MSDKKTLIMDATIRLLSEEGIGVPTAKIAKEAGVSNGTLFNYFETKQDLLDNVCIYIVEKMASVVLGDSDFSGDTKEMLFQLWCRFVSWSKQYPFEDNVLSLLKSSQKVGEAALEEAHNFFAPVNDAMEQAVADGIIQDLPVDLMCNIAVGHLDATVDYIRDNKIKEVEVEDIIRISFDVYWRGISV